MDIVGQFQPLAHLAFGIVVAIQQIDRNPGLAQASHLPDEKEAGVEVLPVPVIDIAGNHDEVDSLFDGA